MVGDSVILDLMSRADGENESARRRRVAGCICARAGGAGVVRDLPQATALSRERTMTMNGLPTLRALGLHQIARISE